MKFNHHIKLFVFLMAISAVHYAHAKVLAVSSITELETALIELVQEETATERVKLENIRIKDSRVSLGAASFTISDILTGRAGYKHDDELAIIRISPQSISQRFEAEALLTSASGEQQNITLYGRYTPLVSVPVLKTSKQLGEPINMTDLTTKHVSERSVRRNVITSPNGHKGMICKLCSRA